MATHEIATSIARRTTSLPVTTNFSTCLWVRQTTSAGQGTIFQIENGAVAWIAVMWISGNAFRMTVTGAGAPANAGHPGLNTWAFVQIRCKGTGASDLTASWSTFASETLTTLTYTGQSFTPTAMFLGDSDGSSAMIGDVAHFKLWDAALTDAEFALEKYSARPVRTANLHLWMPGFNSATADYSGNGRDLDLNGTTWTFVDGPPVGWGARPLTCGWRAPGTKSLLWLPPQGGA